ncbi:tRNA (adenosine(37)-N6)-threonylcarbamoyltransferase complex dimerization subunit type 1 TsaB [Corynebacterium gerontici]|uniref:tRNA threonylcarbamoyladenosine biosynthesis protein TsaB n=1 Tax=Corynebacterium gerontici TaxID=2079234 RepID=A0A3G6J7M7_9CORY|nr:tRNA (adenosine(37)-N6)-threonylcarbamoyltransferase complex dimerization subunit type 1 TsaB [Corynebacterium gerontici]AZA12034.1 tRNA threonylcarbamoyladenosine biosynthesis protein TsaB [Corynebacterium gerontici]
MLVLAIDSATPTLVLGLVRNQELLAQKLFDEPRRHNEVLVPAVQVLLEDQGLSFADLDGVVVGCGPGPFTGLRVGMVSAMAFADALNLPIDGVSTHQAMAHGVEGEVLVLSDARRKEVYFTLIRNGEVIDGPGVCKPAELPFDSASKLIVPEHLIEQLPGSLRGAQHMPSALGARSLVAVADFSAPQPPEPLYLRRPDAKEPVVRISPALVHPAS